MKDLKDPKKENNILKFSISNIGWDASDDMAVYELMKKWGYSGLEIAPTRIFPREPYTKHKEAGLWSKKIRKEYGFFISSMQSIWFGRQEKIFGSKEEQNILLDYTKQAIDFAAAIGCNNLVFGCPKNRNLPNGVDPDVAIAFFKEIGDYAKENGAVIGIEANPPIYGTNYINDTISALELIKKVSSKGFLLNLDVGAMIQNEEDASELINNIQLINHVHISEPGLKPIEKRDLHKELLKILRDGDYKKYISIEMGKVGDLGIIEDKLQYIRSIFMD